MVTKIKSSKNIESNKKSKGGGKRQKSISSDEEANKDIKKTKKSPSKNSDEDMQEAPPIKPEYAFLMYKANPFGRKSQRNFSEIRITEQNFVVGPRGFLVTIVYYNNSLRSVIMKERDSCYLVYDAVKQFGANNLDRVLAYQPFLSLDSFSQKQLMSAFLNIVLADSHLYSFDLQTLEMELYPGKDTYFPTGPPWSLNIRAARTDGYNILNWLRTDTEMRGGKRK